MSDLDFYICFNDADKSWADWISWQLEAAKYKVWNPDWDIRPGNNEVLAIQNALSDADVQKIDRRVILILSPNFTGKTTQEAAWTSIFRQDADGSKGLLIPVVVRPEDGSSGLLASLKRIDLSQIDDEESAVNLLLDSIRNKRLKPHGKPGYPGKHKPIYPSRVAAADVARSPAKKRAHPQLLSRPPDYRLGLLNRTTQRDYFMKQITKNCCLRDGHTLGYILSGPRREWPQAIRFKLAYGLEVDLMGDCRFSPEMKALNAEKSLVGRKPAPFLWELLGVELDCRAEAEEIRNVLGQQDVCHIFYRELSDEEAKKPEFLVGILSAWSQLLLPARSPSHFLLLVRETAGDETTAFRWWPFSKRSPTWRRKINSLLLEAGLEGGLLPELTTLDLETDVGDWMKRYVEEAQRDELRRILAKAFPKLLRIPHAEFKRVLLPVLQRYQSRTE